MYDIAVVSEIGRRPYMEDAIYLKITDQGKGLFCGIYDGHYGDTAAKYTRENLHKFFFKALSVGNSQLDAFVKAYMLTSKNLSHQNSGTTALIFYLKDRTVFWANAGDGRLIVIGGQKVKQLTEDHRLTNQQEYQRLFNSGATIVPPYVYKDGYGLMPTRTLGDEYFKDVGVIARPQTGIYKLTTQDNWLVAGTDGLFDELDNDEIAKLLKGSGNAGAAAGTLKTEVLDSRGGSDSLTLVVLNIKKLVINKLYLRCN